PPEARQHPPSCHGRARRHEGERVRNSNLRFTSYVLRCRRAQMTEDVLKDAEERMKKAIEVLHRELLTIRTGRASPALIDRMNVEYYGTPMPLNQLATISAPEPRMLVVQPWDKG